MAVIKGAKTIAEYKIRKYLLEHGVVMEHFTLSMNGNEATLTDEHNNSLGFVYDPDTKSVKQRTV